LADSEPDQLDVAKQAMRRTKAVILADIARVRAGPLDTFRERRHGVADVVAQALRRVV
jgi:hypothetical protein